MSKGIASAAVALIICFGTGLQGVRAAEQSPRDANSSFAFTPMKM